MVVLPLMGTDNHWYLSHAKRVRRPKGLKAISQISRSLFPHADSFSHTDLTNLTDGASLRPRLSALPSVHIPEESTSDSKCSSWDSWDLCEPNPQDLAFAFFAWSAWSQNHPRVKELERLLNLISTASSVQAERRTSILDYAEAQPILATEWISEWYFEVFTEGLKRLSNLNSVAKIQPQNSIVNTLNASALANKMGGSFAKIGTIDYLCWAKRKIFLLASRNVSNCK